MEDFAQFLNIPQKTIVQRDLSDKIRKMCKPEYIEALSIPDTITLNAIIKPSNFPVAPFDSNDERYEEMHIISAMVSESAEVFSVVRAICATITYPCLLIVQNNNRFLLAASLFRKSKTDEDKYTSFEPALSHWLQLGCMSAYAKAQIEEINSAINESTDLRSMYYAVYHAIKKYPLGGVTKAHATRLVKYLNGAISGNACNKILAQCRPYMLYSGRSDGANKYKPAKPSGFFHTVYDSEELFHLFSTNELTKKFFVGRYQNMEDLVYMEENFGR